MPSNLDLSKVNWDSLPDDQATQPSTSGTLDLSKVNWDNLPDQGARPSSPSLGSSLLGTGIRLAGNVLASEGGPTGAGINAIGEGLAGLAEGSTPNPLDYNKTLTHQPNLTDSPTQAALREFLNYARAPLTRMGVAAGVGSIPAASVMKGGTLSRFLKGAALGAVPTAVTEAASGQDIDPTTVGASGLAGGIGGAILGKLFGEKPAAPPPPPPRNPNQDILDAIAQARRRIPSATIDKLNDKFNDAMIGRNLSYQNDLGKLSDKFEDAMIKRDQGFGKEQDALNARTAIQEQITNGQLVGEKPKVSLSTSAPGAGPGERLSMRQIFKQKKAKKLPTGTGPQMSMGELLDTLTPKFGGPESTAPAASPEPGRAEPIATAQPPSVKKPKSFEDFISRATRIANESRADAATLGHTDTGVGQPTTVAPEPEFVPVGGETAYNGEQQPPAVNESPIDAAYKRILANGGRGPAKMGEPPVAAQENINPAESTNVTNSPPGPSAAETPDAEDYRANAFARMLGGGKLFKTPADVAGEVYRQPLDVSDNPLSRRVAGLTLQQEAQRAGLPSNAKSDTLSKFLTKHVSPEIDLATGRQVPEVGNRGLSETQAPSGGPESPAPSTSPTQDWVKDQTDVVNAAQQNPSLLARIFQAADKLKGNQTGEISPGLMSALGHGARVAGGATLGAASGAALDKEDRLKGAAGGGIAGALLAGAGGDETPTINKLLQWRNAGFLAGPVQAKKPLFDMGSIVTNAVEHLRDNPQLATNLYRQVANNPGAIGRDFLSALKDPSVEQDILGDTAKAQAEDPGAWMGLVRRPLAAFQHASRGLMQRAGMTPEESLKAIGLGESQTGPGKWYVAGQKYPFVRYWRPFARFATNLAENGLQRTPGLNMLNGGAAFGGNPNTLLMRNIMGAGAVGAGAIQGLMESNEKAQGEIPDKPYLKEALAGPYLVPYTMGRGLVAAPGAVRELSNLYVPGLGKTLPNISTNESLPENARQVVRALLEQLAPDFLSSADTSKVPQGR